MREEIGPRVPTKQGPPTAGSRRSADQQPILSRYALQLVNESAERAWRRVPEAARTFLPPTASDAGATFQRGGDAPRSCGPPAEDPRMGLALRVGAHEQVTDSPEMLPRLHSLCRYLLL